MSLYGVPQHLHSDQLREQPKRRSKPKIAGAICLGLNAPEQTNPSTRKWASRKIYTAPLHLVCRVSIPANRMQMSIVEVFVCKCLHVNTSMIYPSAYTVDMQTFHSSAY